MCHSNGREENTVMPRFAANLSLMFCEHPFAERFDAAAQAGFAAVEFHFPYAHPVADVRRWLNDAGLKSALFNLPPGDWAAGERGIASLPGRQDEFRAGLDRALEYALALGTPTLHVMAGVLPAGGDRDVHCAVLIDNLRYAAGLAAAHGITLVVEAINPHDMPGFLLSSAHEVQAICRAVGAPNVRMLLDFYHVRKVGGDPLAMLDALFPLVGHVQIAGVPGRHEPDVGELDYHPIFRRLDALGYGGWIGCEYLPRAGTAAGLGWMARL